MSQHEEYTSPPGFRVSGAGGTKLAPVLIDPAAPASEGDVITRVGTGYSPQTPSGSSIGVSVQSAMAADVDSSNTYLTFPAANEDYRNGLTPATGDYGYVTAVAGRYQLTLAVRQLGSCTNTAPAWLEATAVVGAANYVGNVLLPAGADAGISQQLLLDRTVEIAAGTEIDVSVDQLGDGTISVALQLTIQHIGSAVSLG
jgi:hypothetical protein